MDCNVDVGVGLCVPVIDVHIFNILDFDIALTLIRRILVSF